MSPAFLDANIPMYAGGAEHPYREPALRVLELVSERPSAFVSSAEVLQELLHRYLPRTLWGRGRIVFEGFAELMTGRTVPVLAVDVVYASTLADAANRTGGIEARDLLHAAVMHRLGITRIVSTDRGFDRIEGVTRLDPAHLGVWASSLD